MPCYLKNLTFPLCVGFILILAQPILDAVLFVHILLIVLDFLVPSYRGVFFGHIYPQKLGIGIQLTLEAMTSKDSMDTRYGILLHAINNS